MSDQTLSARIGDAAPTLERLNEGCCPDCNPRYFHPGPRGGEARNVKHANCGSKFWYGPPFPLTRVDNDDQFYNLSARVQLKDLNRLFVEARTSALSPPSRGT